jgi:hypothetical protein
MAAAAPRQQVAMPAGGGGGGGVFIPAAAAAPAQRAVRMECKHVEDVGPPLAKLTQPVALDYSFPGWAKVFGDATGQPTFSELVERQEATLRYSRPAFALAGSIYESQLRHDSGAADDARGSVHLNIRVTQCANGLPIVNKFNDAFAVLFAGIPVNDKVEDGQINGGLASVMRGTNTILNVADYEFTVGELDGNKTIPLIAYTKSPNERFIHFGMRKANKGEVWHVKASTAAKRGEPMRLYINASAWMTPIYTA